MGILLDYLKNGNDGNDGTSDQGVLPRALLRRSGVMKPEVGRNPGVMRPEVSSNLPQSQVSGVREVPKYDGGDVYQYMSRLLGPSPEERQAEEDAALAHKRKMQGWAGFFNGLRHLGNLYFTTRGAPSQQYRTDPTLAVEQNYQAERERLARNREERRQYYSDIWNQERQARRDALDDRRQARLEEDTRIRAEKQQAYANAQYYTNQKNEAMAAYYDAKANALDRGLSIKEAESEANIAYKKAQTRLANVKADNVGQPKPVAETETVVQESVNPETGQLEKKITKGPARSQSGKKQNQGRNDHKSNPYRGQQRNKNHKNNPYG